MACPRRKSRNCSGFGADCTARLEIGEIVATSADEANMTAERWQQIEKLYHAALEVPPKERERCLSPADDEVRKEVESLLRHGHQSGFLDGRAIEVAARYVSIETPELTGRNLGRYEVISRLGAGGMGIVYRARDKRLNRDIALKVLPAVVSPTRSESAGSFRRPVPPRPSIIRTSSASTTSIRSRGSISSPWSACPV